MRNSYTNPSYIFFNDRYIVNADWLIQQFHIPTKTILNGTRRYRLKNSEYWKSFKHEGSIWIYYHTLTKQTFEKYHLPTSKALPKYLQASKTISLLNKQRDAEDFEMVVLKMVVQNHSRFDSFYAESNIPLQEICRITKSHALLDYLVGCTKYSIAKKHQLYNRIYDKSFSFKAVSYHHFSLKLREISQVGIANSLMKKYYGNTNAVRVNKDVVRIILTLYRSPIKLTLNDIQKTINARLIMEGGKPITITTIHRAIHSDPRLKNLADAQRYGSKWAKQKLLPFIHRHAAVFPGDQYQVDGTRVQVAYKDDNGKISFLVMVVVIDVCSRKIVAAEFGEKEEILLYEKVLKQAINTNNFLPFEILTDNFSSFKKVSGSFYDLLVDLKYCGVTWRQHTPENPGNKGHIEAFFKKFQSQYCKKIVGFVGEGITSKNRDAHPSPDYVRQSLKSSHLKTKEQLITELHQQINKYNNSPRLIEERDTPYFIFHDLDKPNIILLTELTKPLFAFEKYSKRIHNATIHLKIDRRNKYYIIENPELALSITGTNVVVRRNPDDESRVYIYEPV